MKSFIRRNAPVFIIGFATLILFIVIIITSQNDDNTSNLPNLIKVREDEEEVLLPPREEEQELLIEENDDGRLGFKTEEDTAVDEARKKHDEITTLNMEEVKAKYGVLEIKYTNEGFNPRNTNAYVGQIVIIKNETESIVTIQQTTPKYSDWENPKKLNPGSSVEFEATKKGLWTYLAQENKDLGAIYFSVPFRQ